MLAQTRAADEIVINDNGSSDATAAIIERYIAAGHPIRLVRGGHNIPSGRNHAIRHATGAVIASCDAGLTLPAHWLSTITAPILRGAADVVGGFYTPDPRSLWELALGATNYPDVSEIDPATFLPAGQSVAFTKAAWEQVGGYPEWADTCEDLVFDLALRRAGQRFSFAPYAAVAFRPRATARAYARQYFTYARGDGVAALWPRRHALRYGFYGGLAALWWLAGRAGRPGWRVAIAPAYAWHVNAPLRRTWRRTARLSPAPRTAALLLVPAIRLIGDGAKMLGYPVGRWRRLRRPPPASAHKEPL